jgi:hypothetical protein
MIYESGSENVIAFSGHSASQIRQSIQLFSFHSISGEELIVSGL